MPPAVAEAAAVATAAANGAFKYNRANYMFDTQMRFGRFTTAYSMAMAQAGQYREDIRDLTGLTVTKMDTYHTLGVIFFVLNFQLIMAGRLGVHGPSPPGWLLGLYWTNICSALMFLVMFTWMSMHASARATAGGAHMLTRNVRLPIPTPRMLDKARCTGNSFEKQRVTDVLRIPFVAPAPKESEKDPELGVRVPISGRKMPKWYHDEVDQLRKDEGGAVLRDTSNPEHFELYRGLQGEWWAHDVYSRVGVLFFMSHWLTSASLYSMCHIFTELRCVWPAWTVVACFVTAHYSILQIDIVNKARKDSLISFPVEKVTPFMPFVAVLGMTIDYSIITPSQGAMIFVYFLSWICYLIQFAWAIRCFDLASPRVQMKEKPESAGEPWWPVEWPVPPAFEHAFYLVAAPKSLAAGQTCLMTEMKAAKGQKGYTAPMKKSRDVAPPMFAWKLFRGACITVISMWVLIMVGRLFEQVNGERNLLKQENRVERWPSHFQPWVAPWSRRGSRNEWCHAGGCDRRLSAQELQQHQKIVSQANTLVKTLDTIANVLAEDVNDDYTKSAAAPVAAELRVAEVEWPAGFHASVLTSHGDDDLMALSADGHVARVQLSSAGHAKVDHPVQLEGLAGLGNVIGAFSDDEGLLISTTSGALAECSTRNAQPEGEKWPCHVVARLPMAVEHAAVARREHGHVQAAVTYAGEDSILLMEYAPDSDTWKLLGEVTSPPNVHSLALHVEELLVALADGSVLSRPLQGQVETHKVAAAPYAKVGFGKSWLGACSVRGSIARLVTEGPKSLASAPKLFVSLA